MYYVYVLRSKSDNRFYTGFTSDLLRRLEEILYINFEDERLMELKSTDLDTII
ncbi:unnamed protein product, partial [marine sediment metagenome]